MSRRRPCPATCARGSPPPRRAHAGDGSGRHWTLTWLEGRPIVELDDGTVVSDAIVDVRDADEDW